MRTDFRLGPCGLVGIRENGQYLCRYGNFGRNFRAWTALSGILNWRKETSIKPRSYSQGQDCFLLATSTCCREKPSWRSTSETSWKPKDFSLKSEPGPDINS